MDVHRETISVAVLDESGRLMMQSVLATRAGAILDFIHGVRGTLHVTFEEGTHSAWLYDVLVRRVAKLVVCNPRKNALLKSGSKSDAIDARKLAELFAGRDAVGGVLRGDERVGSAADGAQLLDQ
jgi:Transposase